MTKKTKIPKARSFRDKYGLSDITVSKPQVYDLLEIGEGDAERGYQRMKSRCSLHGKKHGKRLPIRRKGNEVFVYLEK